MPCMSYESERDETNHAVDEINRLKKINDRLARIACTSLDLLERVRDTRPIPRMSYIAEIEQHFHTKDVKAWWPKHKAEDAKRKAKAASILEKKIQKEAARKRILAVVNPEDLVALGIKL